MGKLDDAYAIQPHVEGSADILARMPTRSDALRATLGDRVARNLSYGDSPRQVIDLYRPEGRSKGTLVFVHGGYWRILTGEVHGFLAAGALARGWSVAMPTYDLCPQVRITDISRQIAAAVCHVARMAEGPISITGHSAGGHLTARMLDPALVPDDVASRYRMVVPIAPLGDLRPLLQTAMNDDFRMDMAAAEAESPVLMTARHRANTAVWVGSIERPALLDQARWLSAAWGADMVIAPGKHHFDVIEALTDPDSNLVRLLTG